MDKVIPPRVLDALPQKASSCTSAPEPGLVVIPLRVFEAMLREFVGLLVPWDAHVGFHLEEYELELCVGLVGCQVRVTVCPLGRVEGHRHRDNIGVVGDGGQLGNQKSRIPW